jgi:dipeptidyl aminopeptidase/acylaminoacyl peptidase
VVGVTEFLRALLEMRQALPLSWSPDGERLLVQSNVPGTKQLFVWPSMEQLTSYTEPASGLFLPDGRVLVSIDEGGNERGQLHVLDEGPLVVDPDYVHSSPTAAASTLAYSTNRRNGVDFDVVARSLETGEEQVFELAGLNHVAAISSDGRQIVVAQAGVRSGDDDLYLCDCADGSVSHLTPHDEPAEFYSPVFTAGGLVWSTNEGRDTFAVLRGDEVLYESQWDVDVVGNERRLVAHENADGYSRLVEIGGEEIQLPGRGVADALELSPDGSKLAFGFSTAREPYDVWIWSFADRSLTRATTSPRALDVGTLAEPELHRFASFDNESVPVFLFVPEGDGPFPVVVAVHGGPEAQWRPSWLPMSGLVQFLVAQGYAVAAPNVRGSTGYGKRYEHLDDIELRLDSVEDLRALHGWLASRPEIDAARAVVYGRSYGGYMTLAALAFQPELWAAGIEGVGISSLVTFLENTSPYRRAAREREYGSLERDREFLLRASPMTHIDAVRAPLFIQHGRNDPRVPVGESEHIAEVLTEKGIECELLIHEDEGHAIEKLANRIETFERATAFLGRVLGS